MPGADHLLRITTAAAFLAFARSLPTGASWRSGSAAGSTQPTSSPGRACALISSISMDHKDFLGDTLAKIAFEKAGVLKPGVPGRDRAAATPRRWR